VLSPSCAEADAWATAFSVIGAEQSLELAQEHDLAVYMLVRENEQFVTQSSASFDLIIN
jgi:thiamine biosynthesis lipoprotein